MGRSQAGAAPSGHAGRAATLLAILAVVLVVWLPRGLDLDRTVTSDESIWLARSANFSQALGNGDLRRTYQYAHPGVTTMWAGAVAFRLELPGYADWGPRSTQPWGNGVVETLREGGADPLALLAAARAVLVLLVTVGLVALVWLATRLLGVGVGLLGGGLVALDPFHVAHSQLLHVDATASVLVAVSAVAWLVYLLRGHARRDLAIAGVALGLAALTRTTAVVVLPMLVVSALVEGAAARPGRPAWRGITERLRPVAAVGLIAAGTFVVAWPAMWTDPLFTLRSVVVGSRNLTERAHDKPVFFAGRIYDGVDPGMLFYPTALLWRTTPALLAGLAAAALVAVVALARGRGRPAPGPAARGAAYLALLAATALLLLSASDKKFDRYAVLLVPPLALVTGWGYGALARAVRQWVPALPAAAFAGAGALVLAATAAETVASAPYPLSYYNRLLGGAAAAQEALMVGSGEGMDQIAAALDRLPDVDEASVVTSTWEASLAFFTAAEGLRLVDLTTGTGVGDWLQADYYVWDVTSDQRGAVPPAVRGHIAGLTPLRSVELGGVTYARLYDLREGGVPRSILAASTPTGEGEIRLLTSALPTDPVEQGEDLPVTLYLAGETPNPRRVPLRIALVDAQGRERAGTNHGFLPPPPGAGVFEVPRRVGLPVYLRPGGYRVVVRFGLPEEGVKVVLGMVTVERPPPSPAS